MIIVLHSRRAKVVAMAALASLFALALVFYAEESLAAAKEGIKVFGLIVLPSLFPFFVLSEVLLGLGVVHFMGVIFEPLMRPVFNVPGVGAFALSMGLAAGYPMDAVITAKFRRKGLCSRIEAERLLAFTNTADPLFIFGAVAVGMFGLPALGPLLATAHYLSSFTLGFFFRFYGREDTPTEEPAQTYKGMLRRAFAALLRGREEDGRPLGQLLGEAVRESVATLFMIGGFIVFFSVLVRLLTVMGLLEFLAPPAARLLGLFGLSPSLVPALFRGLLEIDLGTVAAGRAAAPLVERAVMAGAIIAWSGLSVHGQVASVVHGTDIRMGPYVLARLYHAVIAGFYTFLLFPFFRLPVFLAPPARYCGLGLVRRFVFSAWQLAFLYVGLTVAAFLLHLGRRYRPIWGRR
ncbi:MAG: sporulation integral membrane protein YlbJ [Bacillota bacterium]